MHSPDLGGYCGGNGLMVVGTYLPPNQSGKGLNLETLYLFFTNDRNHLIERYRGTPKI